VALLRQGCCSRARPRNGWDWWFLLGKITFEMDRTSQKPYKKTGFQQLGLALKQPKHEDFIEIVI
jgi:hypothetical protein